MAPRFPDEEDEILAEEAAKHPSLWQLSHPKCKGQRVKDNVRAEVGDKLENFMPVHTTLILYLVNFLLNSVSQLMVML